MPFKKKQNSLIHIQFYFNMFEKCQILYSHFSVYDREMYIYLCLNKLKNIIKVFYAYIILNNLNIRFYMLVKDLYLTSAVFVDIISEKLRENPKIIVFCFLLKRLSYYN